MNGVRSITITIVAVLLSVTIQAQPLPPSASERVVTQDARLAAATLVGSGITVTTGIATTPWQDHVGRRIVWKPVRNDLEPNGRRHVFYRQALQDVDGTTAELMGSEVGLHYSGTGDFRALAGRQFTAVVITNHPVFTPSEAPRRALKQLELQGFRGRAYEALSPSERLHRESRTELLLQTADGLKFRYVYRTFATSAEGIYYEVVMDAATGEIVATAEVNLHANCAPSQYNSQYAIGIPVRNTGVTRSLAANYAPDRSPYIYEGFFQSSVHMSVLQDTQNQPFKCVPTSDWSYTLFPVVADLDFWGNYYPVYRDDAQHPEWKGSAAGDALDRTNQTMGALSQMGWSSWTGSGTDANIVIESHLYGSDLGTFLKDSGGDPSLPAGGCVLTSPPNHLYEVVAALDVISHEWGHGVIYNSANFKDTPVYLQLHEGFADVVGQMTEKLREPGGRGLELSDDWSIGEDIMTSGPYLRSGEVDDGESGHEIYPGYVVNDTLHRDDSPFDQESHDRGNMLNVVFMLLSNGGLNPICARGSFSGCSSGAVNGLGFFKASRILFDTLTRYSYSGTLWEDLPTNASLAAFENYATCTGPGTGAVVEQASVNSAFRAIGYSRQTPPVTCQ